MFDYFRVPGVSTIHESKLVAWALFMGERNRIVSSPYRSVRPHRGMLPDIDPANAVLDPARRSLLRRLAAFLRGLGGPVEALEIAPAALLPEHSVLPVGKPASVAYIDGSDSQGAAAGPAAETADYNNSRAA